MWDEESRLLRCRRRGSEDVVTPTMLYAISPTLFVVGGLLCFGLTVAVGLVVAWLLFAADPRLGRALRALQRRLEEGDWSGVLSEARAHLADPNLPPHWVERFRKLASDCLNKATEDALSKRLYEQALTYAQEMIPLTGATPVEARQRVVDHMLAETRRLFSAANTDAELQTIEALLTRLFQIQTVAPEASFWLALSLIRKGEFEAAANHLVVAQEQVGKQFLDPALYLGMLLHRLGRPQDAIRYLADANRTDGTCPFIPYQMGLSLVASGGDAGLALRALQRALGPRGLSLWKDNPTRVWIEAFPDGRSYVRRLASRHPYTCPLLGRDLNLILRLGELGLAQAQYRLGNFQESANLYTRLMGDSAPTLLLLRGLGLSLARLGRYDEAYKHLRTALEMEEGKDPLTAGYLALCGALGKPTKEEDRPKNVAWAMRLLSRYKVGGNTEWSGLVSAVHAEARNLGMQIPVEDQVHLCQALASVQAVDATAAAAYDHLATTAAEQVLPVHAWLFARAASVTGYKGISDLNLFSRTFLEPHPAGDFFNRMGWDLALAEFTYLERCADLDPGHFPSALGSSYANRGEQFLLERSRKMEEAGQKDAALASADVLMRLAPESRAGHDRLACLHYRQGDLDRAVALLEGWRRLDPQDHWPLVRQAIIEQERGNAARRSRAIDEALGLTRGPLRAAVAFLGARLALRTTVKEWEDRPLGTLPRPSSALDQPEALLHEVLREQPEHVDALWCLAAIRSVKGDKEALAGQAQLMNRPAVTDSRFHYLGAVCHLAAEDYERTVELSKRAALDPGLAPESHFVMAWAYLRLQQPEAATQALLKVVGSETNPSVGHARALLGRLSFQRGNYDEAVRWWRGLDEKRRSAWGLDDPVRQTILLAGLLAFDKGRFEMAAERFREAGKMGLRDKRLGSLLTLALVKAGQRLLFDSAVNGHQAQAER
jgi:tetratricopeptide (TPR) repeat protein